MNNFNLSALNMFTTCIINYTQGARSESFLFMKLSWYIVLINEIIINNHNYIMLFCRYSRAIFKWIWWKSRFTGQTIHGRWSYQYSMLLEIVNHELVITYHMYHTWKYDYTWYYGKFVLMISICSLGETDGSFWNQVCLC